MKFKKAVAFGAAVGVAIAGLAFSAPASAEPVTEGYAITGSDTLQDVMNALVNGTNVTGANVRVVPGNTPMGNYDAFPTGSFIQTKPYGTSFTRPNGSGAGVTSLRASINGTTLVGGKTIAGLVDIARSSSAPATADISATGRLAYVPFGRDAVGYAYKLGAGVTAPAGIEQLTTSQLTQLYNGTLTSLGGVTINPRLPISTSGTRSFFLSAIGINTGNPLLPSINTASANIPENDATVLNTVAANTIDVIPFSVAQWVSQANGVAQSNTTTTAGVLFGNPNNLIPFTGVAPALVPSASFYAAAPFGRDVYLVVDNSRLDSANPLYDANLAQMLDSTIPGSLTRWPASPTITTTAAVKIKFGFLAPSSSVVIRAVNTP